MPTKRKPITRQSILAKAYGEEFALAFAAARTFVQHCEYAADSIAAGRMEGPSAELTAHQSLMHLMHVAEARFRGL